MGSPEVAILTHLLVFRVIVRMAGNQALLVATVAMTLVAGSSSADEISFSRDIRPLLAENCFQCHGPDEAAREADLRLDALGGAVGARDGARDGAAAIVPGDSAGSALIARVTAADPDTRMPPAETGKALTPAQIDLLRRWIDAGAVYDRHWSFRPVRRPLVPPVPPRTGADDARNPIDCFVLAQLDRRGLAPLPRADRHTLVRRLYLDLLGLPPSIGQADEFVQDESPDAYERLVDRLLASPRLGERWGRHWLDQARYADSHGYTNDNERVMWPYRDWVIDAINRDLPFDRFTVEQIAGDLLPEPSVAQVIATGFHRNTLINTEGGTKADQFRDEQVKDRVDTTGGVWLGLTVGCAKCHSHKYDPITQAEYYRLYAFFNSTADENSVPPVQQAPTRKQRTLLRDLDAKRSELRGRLDQDPGRQDRQRLWEARLLARRAEPVTDSPSENLTPWTALELDGKSEEGAVFRPLDDRSSLVSGNDVAGDFYQLTALSPLTEIRSVRLEVLTHDDLPRRGPGRADNGNFVLAEFWFRTGDGRELRFSKAGTDHSQPDFDVDDAIDGRDDTGWAINGSPEGGPNHDRTAWFVLPTPLEVELNHELTFNLRHLSGANPYNIGRLRLSVSDREWVDSPSEDKLARLVAIPVAGRGTAQRNRIDDAFLRDDETLGPVFRRLRQVERQRDELLGRIAATMVMRELDRPRATHVQQRGDFLRPGEPVGSGVPGTLPPLDASDRSPSRLDLARWLVASDNPLTPRVRVNRLWMRLFGRGLVETENDFGTQGTAPTHPELLDWLASEYVRQGWSTKRMLRLIVNSATYQRRSDFSKPGSPDPTNLLLWRQNRLRVEGEIVRDLALDAGGLLSDKIGGPSVHPPQPSGVYAFTQRAKDWNTSEGEDRYRRGMYTFFYRSAPYPMLTTFDAPKFNQTCTRRDRSNTPLQSLTVANDVTMFEAARALARRVLIDDARGRAADDLATRLFRAGLVRPPSDRELEVLLKYHQRQRTHFRRRPDDARRVAPEDLPPTITSAEGAAWVAVARVVLNLDEFITRE